MSRAERHAIFEKLHDRSALLILPNAWDAASAKLMADAGSKAVATTSSGVANALGFPDGNKLPKALAIAALERIVAAVDVPVSADVEAGYSDNPGEVAAFVSAICEAGAVGINLEDGTQPPALLAAKIEAIRAQLSASGTPLFINARVDPFLHGHERPLKEAIERAGRYLKAGASGIFVPGIVTPDDIRTLCAEVPAPINVLLRPMLTATPDELFALGVARLSAGHMIYSAAMGFALNTAQGFLARGDYKTLYDNAIPREVNQRLFT